MRMRTKRMMRTTRMRMKRTPKQKEISYRNPEQKMVSSVEIQNKRWSVLEISELITIGFILIIVAMPPFSWGSLRDTFLMLKNEINNNIALCHPQIPS